MDIKTDVTRCLPKPNSGGPKLSRNLHGILHKIHNRLTRTTPPATSVPATVFPSIQVLHGSAKPWVAAMILDHHVLTEVAAVNNCRHPAPSFPIPKLTEKAGLGRDLPYLVLLTKCFI